jgi:hypothetical protein
MTAARHIEHRWSSRHPVAMEVTLSSGGQHSRSAICRDIGIGGMYVEADTGLLQTNDQVVVGFTLGDANVRSHHRLRTRVIWVSGRGAGLMFSEFLPETVRALRETPHGKKDPSRQAQI